MSKIDELIQELCPEGVKFVNVRKVCTVFNGYAFKAELFNSDSDGLPLIRIRDVNSGYSDTFYSGEYDPKWLVSDGDILIGMDGDFRVTRWNHGAALLNQRVCRLQEFSDEVIPGFIFHKIQDELDRIHSGISGSTVKHLSSKELEKSRIPLPPLAVQQEIVRILDMYIELEKELEKELEARRKQYFFYRDSLLTFPEQGDVRWLPLGEVVDINKSRVPVINLESHTFVGVDNLLPSFLGRTDSDYLPKEGSAISFKPGDILVGNIRPYLKKVWHADRVGGASPDVLTISLKSGWKNELFDQYLYFLIANDNFIGYSMKTSKGAKMPRGDKAAILKYMIPVPSISQQHQIVDSLTNFEEFTKNITSGLPAEISARRKQYEYYRDKLLTFKELAA